MQKFYTNTTVSKFIKNLVAKNPIPMINTYSDGDIMLSNMLYIKNDYIVKCNYKDGFIIDSESTNIDNYLDIIEPYIFGEHYDGITTTYKSNINSYDSTTHYYLGQYLRAIRDIKGIDLMPFYNCYNSTYIKDIKLYSSTTNSIDFKILTDPKHINEDYKLIAIPIKFFKTYTIAVDCTTPYYIMPMIYGNKGIIKDNLLYDMSKYFGQKCQSSYFNKPYKFKVDLRKFVSEISNSLNDYGIKDDDNAYKKIASYEKFLYLLIQLPINNKSSIVVLEGDYTDKKGINIIDTSRPEFSTLSYKQLNNLLLSDLSLLNRNDGNSYAFSDRLIEYLLLNAITSDEDITQNISRIQTYATSLTNQKLNNYPRYMMFNNTKGVWSNDLRYYLYSLVMSSKYLKNKYDINGFVDKDVEKIITRGQGV